MVFESGIPSYYRRKDGYMCWFVVLIKNTEEGDVGRKKELFHFTLKVIFLFCKYDKQTVFKHKFVLMVTNASSNLPLNWYCQANALCYLT